MNPGALHAALFALASTLPAGCGGVNLWPFGDSGREISRVPANAAEYQCDGGKRFYVRNLDNGAAVWLILPEREVRLNKLATAASSGSRYAAGKLELEINAQQAALSDPPTAYSGCKIGSAREEK